LVNERPIYITTLKVHAKATHLKEAGYFGTSRLSKVA